MAKQIWFALIVGKKDIIYCRLLVMQCSPDNLLSVWLNVTKKV